MLMTTAPVCVCMFSNLYPPVISGSSTQTASLARELTRRGHKVIVLTAHVEPHSSMEEEIEGVTIHRLPAFRLPKLPIALNFPWLSWTFSFSNLRRIETILAHYKPDILHLHNHMFDLALSATLMRRRTGRPLVTTLHTIIHHSETIYNFVLHPVDRLILKRLVIDQSDQLICPDINIERYARKAFSRTDVVVIPYGIDPPQPLNKDRVKQLRDIYKLHGKRIILSLGHLHKIRDRQDLVAAMPEILNVFPETVLLIVGEISTNVTQKLACSLGVERSVIFTGSISHQTIPDFFEMADLEAHWLNQEEPEHTSPGIASLEAMSAGKVVLAAANPDTYGSGLLTSGENILIVQSGHPTELAKTIIGLLQNDTRRLAIGKRASQTIREHFSWDRVCEKTIQIYQAAIQNRAI